MTDIDTSFPVLIPSDGTTLAGRIHRRADSPRERQPGVLVMGSWLTVKEQMADHYAVALAARGYTAITFDFAGWGSSGGWGTGGDLRHVEHPSRKIADVVAAAAYASTLSLVRPGGIGCVGVCASAQYALAAIAQGARIGAFASVAGWFHDTASVASFYGGTEGVSARLQRARTATEQYLRTGELA